MTAVPLTAPKRFLQAVHANASSWAPGIPVGLVMDPAQGPMILVESGPSYPIALVPVGQLIPHGMRFVAAIAGPSGGALALYVGGGS